MVILETIYLHSIHIPDKIAIFEGEHEITYAELWQQILRSASYFSSVGNKGDRILLAGTKNLEFVYNYFGAHLAGLIVVTLDPEINEIRLKRILSSVNPIGIYGGISAKGFDITPFPILKEWEPLEQPLFPSDEEPADILFTTGTTGLPKGVVLTHSNEWAAATNINEFIGNSKESVELLALPISHSFGLGRLRCILQIGATIDLLGSFVSMKKFYREIEFRHITGFGLVPASWNYIHKMSGDKIGNYASQIHYIEIGSAFMPMTDKIKLLELLPQTRICMHYGLTEASRSAFICFNEEREHLSSIGRPSPHVDIRIFDEIGKECISGTEGEVCVKWNHVCSDYWGDSHDEYLLSFYGDYFRTGDWGYQDANNYLYLKSRKKEIINVGGKKVSPIEVEEVINEIESVYESACIGVPDPVLGEVVKAFIVSKKDSKLTAETIVNYTLGKLEKYKVPMSIEFITSIPKTSSGKIQRLLLKKDK